jgi:hypothetical protein
MRFRLHQSRQNTSQIHTVLSGVFSYQQIRDTVAQSELVYLNVHRVQLPDTRAPNRYGNTEIYDGAEAPKSCSLEVRNRLAKNQAKYYPHIKTYDEFLNSENFRFSRNTSDVWKIDSMYRTERQAAWCADGLGLERG